MRVDTIEKKRPIEFEKIRNATVFTCNGEVYIKGDDVYAMNISTGNVVQPMMDKNSDKFETCYIYPKARLHLS